MSENVSSAVLFHFTKSVGSLESILRNGFFPHYCPEYTLHPVDRKAAAKGRPPMHAAPMVCFCDLPLSLIRKHLEYGKFAIGLNKEWGLKNRLAPVIYTHSRAQTRPTLLRLPNKEMKGSDKAARDRMFLAAYTKPFEGPAWRENKVQKKVRFYDEREWRYIPPLRENLPLFLGQKDYNDTSKKNALHRRLRKQHALPIHPDYIQYLIVPYDKHEKNILKLHDYVMGFYETRYSRKDAILVTTAIMTVDRVQEDV
jgi:Putative abortive phage resistance protein AbiGi, antitoxin